MHGYFIGVFTRRCQTAHQNQNMRVSNKQSVLLWMQIDKRPRSVMVLDKRNSESINVITGLNVLVMQHVIRGKGLLSIQ